MDGQVRGGQREGRCAGLGFRGRHSEHLQERDDLPFDSGRGSGASVLFQERLGGTCIWRSGAAL